MFKAALALFLTLVAFVASDLTSGTVYLRSGVPLFVLGREDPKGAAYGSFNDTMSTTGWTTLTVTTSSLYKDSDQAFSAGYLEASLSQERIWQYYTNFVANEWGHAPPAKMMSWLQSQLLYVLCGFLPANQRLSEVELYMINAAGDVETLSGAVGNVQMKGRNISDPIERGLMMDCSSLVKALPDYSNVFSSQVTWRGFYAMLRVYKYYNFAFVEPSTSAQSVGFASQPGFLSSKDDFYTTSAGLTVMETTNDVFDTSLYSKLTTQSVLCWMRSILANRMASSGVAWTSTFARYNSGTYNNQWIVVDYNQFVPGSPSKSGFIWILEQIPGFTQSGDVTDVFWKQGGYWPSYNIPYFSNIYEMSGYPAMEQKSTQYSYTQCARAQIFARNQSMVTDDASMRALMQFNDYIHDPLSLGLASNAIASRYDLRSNSTSAAFGAIDAKNTCFYRMKSLAVSAISGPTHQNLPAFQWSSTPWMSQSHLGLPDKYDFDWQEFTNSK